MSSAEDAVGCTSARVEAIALAIVQASPLDALERISGPALTALAHAVLGNAESTKESQS